MKRFALPAAIAVVLLSFYWEISSTVFRFRHPELTKTQVVLKWSEVIRWK